ncbi:hypothetical protein AB0F72_40745 [Actinoplanes sp. NPDC023936]|uniref:hypothetical protein n=1 Tax=Actinoplanes sp. NPDC023936 TaxID=3154910 RepID=UPI0033C87F88
MIVDDRVEPLVREIFGAVVKRDEDKLDAVLNSFPDDDSRLKGLHLALAVCGFVVHDAYDGKPTPDEIRLLADEISSMEQWSALSGAQVTEFLDAVLHGKSLTPLFDPVSATMLTYVVTGSLLASSTKIRKGEWWFNYLDRVEAAIEAAPER